MCNNIQVNMVLALEHRNIRMSFETSLETTPRIFRIISTTERLYHNYSLHHDTYLQTVNNHHKKGKFEKKYNINLFHNLKKTKGFHQNSF